LENSFDFWAFLPALAVHDVLELGMSGHAGLVGVVQDAEGGKRGIGRSKFSR